MTEAKGTGFNEDKTRVVHLEEGCDFLGLTIRRYHGKLLIKPSREAVRRIRNRLRAEVRSLHGANAAAVLQRLNPIIRGWSACYRSVVAGEVFTALDDYMWKLTYKWATHRCCTPTLRRPAPPSGNNGCEALDRRTSPGKSPIAGSKRRTGCNSSHPLVLRCTPVSLSGLP